MLSPILLSICGGTYHHLHLRTEELKDQEGKTVNSTTETDNIPSHLSDKKGKWLIPPGLRGGKGPSPAVPPEPSSLCGGLPNTQPASHRAGPAGLLYCAGEPLASAFLPSTLHAESPSQLSSGLFWSRRFRLWDFSSVLSPLSIPLTVLWTVRALVPRLRPPPLSSRWFLPSPGWSVLSSFGVYKAFTPHISAVSFKHRQCLGFQNTSTNVWIRLLSSGKAYLPSSWVWAGLHDCLLTKKKQQTWPYTTSEIRLVGKPRHAEP